MTTGTKSILYGTHQFLIHPFYVFIGWWRLYGFPWDPRLWFCFLVHDLGYLGKSDIEGKTGRQHVEFGAKIAGFLFGKRFYNECLGHSRYYATEQNIPLSRLCYADKLAFVIEPIWLYLFKACLSGEIKEYRMTSVQWCPLWASNRDWHTKLRDRILSQIKEGLPGVVWFHSYLSLKSNKSF